MEKNTDVSMKEFFTEKFTHIEEKLKLIFDMHKIALDKASIELTIKIKIIEDELEELKKRPTFLTASIASTLTFILGVLGALLVNGLIK